MKTVDFPFNFYQKLKDAAGFNPTPNPAGTAMPAQGNQDAGLNMQKLAEQNAAQKLGSPSPQVMQQIMPGTAPYPLTPDDKKKKMQ